MSTEPETFYACPVCKSHRLQSQMWVRTNTGEVLDDTERYAWCDACEADGHDAEIRPQDLLLIPAAETREGIAPERGVTVVLSGGIVEDVIGLPLGTPFTVVDYDIENYSEEELEEDGDGLRFKRIELES